MAAVAGTDWESELADVPVIGQRDSDYDMEGAVKAGIKPSMNGHWPDTFKRPTHITFSTDSKYSNEKTPGGVWRQDEDKKWSYTPSAYVLQQHPAEELKEYFRKREPDSRLILPEIDWEKELADVPAVAADAGLWPPPGAMSPFAAVPPTPYPAPPQPPPTRPIEYQPVQPQWGQPTQPVDYQSVPSQADVMKDVAIQQAENAPLAQDWRGRMEENRQAEVARTIAGAHADAVAAHPVPESEPVWIEPDPTTPFGKALARARKPVSEKEGPTLGERRKPVRPDSPEAYFGKRLPFAGAVVEGAELIRLGLAVRKIRSGEATDADYDVVANHVAAAERAQNRDWTGKVFDAITMLPGYGIEFAATGGAYAAGRKVVEKGAKKLIGRAMERGVVGLGTRTLARATGVITQTAANPQAIARNTVQRMVPEFKLTRDEAGQLGMEVSKEDPSFIEALEKGALDAGIELGSERGGVALGWLGKAFGRVPGVAKAAAAKAAVINRFLTKGKTYQQFQEVLKSAGWNGVFGEIFEERLGDVARGATGVEPDYGTTGQLLTNNPKGWEQLGIEVATFLPFGLLGLAAGMKKPPVVVWREANPDKTPSREDAKKIGIPPEITKAEERAAYVDQQVSDWLIAKDQADAQQVTEAGAPDGGGGPQPGLRQEGGGAAESSQGVQPGGRGNRDTQGQAAPQTEGEAVGKPADRPPDSGVGFKSILKSPPSVPRTPAVETFESKLREVPALAKVKVTVHDYRAATIDAGEGRQLRVETHPQAWFEEPGRFTEEGLLASREAGGQAGPPIAGYDAKTKTLHLGEGFTPEQAGHEVVHAMRDIGMIAPAEIARFGGEERMAYAYGDWVKSGRQAESGLFQRIWDFVTSLVGSKAAKQRGILRGLDVTKGESAAPPEAPGVAPGSIDLFGRPIAPEAPKTATGATEKQRQVPLLDKRGLLGQKSLMDDVGVPDSLVGEGKSVEPAPVEPAAPALPDIKTMTIPQLKDELKAAGAYGIAFAKRGRLEEMVRGVRAGRTYPRAEPQFVAKQAEAKIAELAGEDPAAQQQLREVAEGILADKLVGWEIEHGQWRAVTDKAGKLTPGQWKKLREGDVTARKGDFEEMADSEVAGAGLGMAEGEAPAKGREIMLKGEPPKPTILDALGEANERVQSAAALERGEFVGLSEAERAREERRIDSLPSETRVQELERQKKQLLEELIAEDELDTKTFFSGLSPSQMKVITKLLIVDVKLGIVRFSDWIEKIGDRLGEALDRMRPGLFVAWNKEAERNPALEKADKDAEVPREYFDWEIGERVSNPARVELDAHLDKMAANAKAREVGEKAPAEEPPFKLGEEPPKKAPVAEQGGDRTYSIKNAATAADREAKGMPERTPPVRHGWEQARAEAAAASEGEIDTLMHDLQNDPKMEISDTQVFMLDRRKIDLEKSYAADAVGGKDNPGRRAELMEAYNLWEKAGTPVAQSLAARAAVLEADFSLSARLGKALKANQGKPLSSEAVQKIAELTARIAELEAQPSKVAEDAVAPVIDKIEKAVAPPSYSKQVLAAAEHIASRMDEIGNAGLARFRERHKPGTIHTLDVSTAPAIVAQDILDLSLYGASRIVRGMTSFAEWSAHMVEVAGESIKPHLQEIWKASQKQQDKQLDRIKGLPEKERTAVKEAVADRAENVKKGDTIEGVTAKIEKRLNKDGVITSEMTHKLARMLVESGIHGREPVLTALHDILKSIKPDITRRKTADLLSRRGQVSEAEQEAAAIEVADIKRQLQLVENIAAIREGKHALHTGRQRNPPSEAVRDLEKQLGEEMREHPMDVTDPTRQLKSALDAAKTAVKNQIEDLEQEIRTREAIVSQHVGIRPDAELLALRARRDELMKVRKQIFPKKKKPPLTEPEEIAKLEKQRVEKQRKIDENDIATKEGEPRLSTPELDRRRAEVAVLDKRIAAMRKAAKEADLARWESEGGAAEDILGKEAATELDRLDRVIAQKKADLAAGKIGPKEKGTKPTNAQIEAAHAKIDALNALADEMRAASPEYQKGVEERKRAAFKRQRAKQLADLLQQVAEGAPWKKPLKKKPVLDLEDRDRKYDIQQAKMALVELQNDIERQNQTVVAKAIGEVGDIADLSQTIMTAMEFSFVLKQAAFYTLGMPEKAFPALWKSVGSMFSRKMEFGTHENLRHRPNALLGDYDNGGLETTTSFGPLSAREELFRSRLVDLIGGHKFSKLNPFSYPLHGAAEAIHAFTRAFRTFCNIMRADLFDYQKATIVAGRPWTADDAKIVGANSNIFSGRGTVGSHAVGIGRLWFAPRWRWSRAQLLVGQPLWKGDYYTKKAALKIYGRMLVGWTTYNVLKHILYSLTADDEEHKPKYELSPLSSDFGKTIIGNTRSDIGAGITQLITLGARIGTGTMKGADGKIIHLSGPEHGFKDPNEWDLVTNYARSGFAPLPSGAVDWKTGENVVHQPATLASVLYQRFSPMTWNDVYEAEEELNLKQGTLAMLEAFFGANVRTYQPKNKGLKKSDAPWYDPFPRREPKPPKKPLVKPKVY